MAVSGERTREPRSKKRRCRARRGNQATSRGFLVTSDHARQISALDRRAAACAMQTEPIPGLPEHVVSTHVLKFLEDPADLARFKTVSRAARDAVVATRRRVRELEEQEAAELGCLNALRRLERRGLLDKQHFCSVAAGSGHLHVLKWGREIGCPWDTWTCASAAWGGHLEMLRYLRRAGCPWDARTSAAAAIHEDTRLIEFVHTNGCAWSKYTCANAASVGNLNALRYAREHLCPWNEWTCFAAAERGHVDVLRWCKENDAPWDARTIIVGARGGHPEAHLEVLTWLRAESKCRYDDRICRVAAERGARYVVDGMRDRCGCACEMHSLSDD